MAKITAALHSLGELLPRSRNLRMWVLVNGSLGTTGLLNCAFIPRTTRAILLSPNGDAMPLLAHCQFMAAMKVSSTDTERLGATSSIKYASTVFGLGVNDAFLASVNERHFNHSLS